MQTTEQRKAWAAVAAVLKQAPDSPDLIIERCENEATEREAQARILLVQAKAFRQMIESVETLSGREPSVQPEDAPPGYQVGRTFSTPERPAGIDAARIVMREGGIWTVKSLLAELENRGWESRNAKDPVKATEAIMSRLWKVKGELERVGRGQYRYKQEGPPGSPSDDLALETWAATS